MNILLLSAGGGGGNILRSLKASFKRDLAVTQQSDSRYAERLRRAVTTRFLDTNEFALSDVPKDERFLIGTQTTGRLGARHDPDVARHALTESRSEVEALFSRYSIVILVGTVHKGVLDAIQYARELAPDRLFAVSVVTGPDEQDEAASADRGAAFRIVR